ncbi:hypothetical protein B0T22DRAFT_142515 [Podospora appendiculata]|uniref:Chitin-binding type-4 domain-containing protein n=1 Tax=Podospora appendiculata TaxID=314037 RepID=A0AAE0X8D2_9PEZI|nr:hypothetical protein B0T22DRAFT_142515 [Podospora appendiculata]
MGKSLLLAFAALAAAATVSAHGNITSPPARLPGAAMAKACGQTGVTAVLQDGTIPLENLLPSPASCQLFLCRGAVFADNTARVQTFTAGQVIPFTAIIPIPHEGPANVSIVNTATNTIIGTPLLVFDSYADESLPALPANNTAFSVTLPTGAGAAAVAANCAVAGACVLQWFWFGTAAKQTYESCVDFTFQAAAAGSAANTAAPVPAVVQSNGAAGGVVQGFGVTPAKRWVNRRFAGRERH